MKTYSLALKYMKADKLPSMMQISVFAIAISILLLAINLTSQLQGHFRQGGDIDAVIGAKGSPLQLVLSSVYHVDIPNGNIDYAQAQKLMRHPQLKQAVPVSLGDNVKSFRIVGTNHDFLSLYDADLTKGRTWKKPMEAVIGQQVAEATGLAMGDKFAGSHGLVQGGDAHEHMQYHVVGVLERKNSVIDRLVLTSLDSVWNIHSPHAENEHHHEDEHEHEDAHDHDHHDSHAHVNDGHGEREEHDAGHQHHAASDAKAATHESQAREITALLVEYRQRVAAYSFPRMINKNTNMLAASPTFEIAKLFQTVGIGFDAMKAIGLLLLAVAVLGVFIILVNNVRRRQYDLAMLRVCGKKPADIVALVVYEGLFMSLSALVLGFMLSRCLLFMAHLLVSQQFKSIFAMDVVAQGEWMLAGILLMVSLLASLVPAWMAYRLNIVDLLLKRS